MQLKKVLSNNNQQLQQDFNNNIEIKQLLHKRSDLIDTLLVDLWEKQDLSDYKTASLIAVGGYGRREMHPFSDIDLLLLLKTEPTTQEQEQLSNFIASLWDLGLEIGQSVRTLDECIEEAEKDLTIITNLMESRLLIGNTHLFQQLQILTKNMTAWSSSHFLTAKLEEQKKRYKHYGDSSYRVEPNLKEGPGGMRDIQMIDWIIQREYGTSSLLLLTKEKIVSPEELAILVKGRNYLWQVRFVLHQLAGRKEDRLLFNYQRPMAKKFGYEGSEEDNECIESFMQKYYCTITSLERITEVVLGILRQRILKQPSAKAEKIHPLYVSHQGYLGLIDEDVFQTHPHALLEVFHMLQITPHMVGMLPNTIRAIRANLPLIDQKFRDNTHHKLLFMRIMSESHGITFVLHRMNRYGVLAAYLPAFANIVGRMQYDLFHAYTVDEHTLKVIRNVRRLTTREGAEKFPFCSNIFQLVEKPKILYLASLFHDIAKGRGGSHSEKGAQDALDFCLAHKMDTYSAHTVSWLVQKHLLMSSIAQRKDISDPDVIRRFADQVSLTSRLDYLYLLTISDIRATNPTLLTSWKYTLLKDLYRNTRDHLLNKGSISTKTDEIIEEKKQSVQQHALLLNISTEAQHAFWNRLNDNYILHTPIYMLCWHISLLANNKQHPLIAIQQDDNSNSSTLLFIYERNHDDFFVRITLAIEKMQLNIVAARIYFTKDDQYSLVTLHLLNTNGKPISDKNDIAFIQTAVEKSIKNIQPNISRQHYRIPRQLKYFDTPTRVSFSQDKTHQQTVITIKTADSPRLLTHISQVFYEHGIHLHSARIATLGEEVEDIFHISLSQGKPLEDSELQTALKEALQQRLTYTK
ncbi:MAG: [protein-PII] uridylyltransferase [Cocleimonas sp.]|nr:[protein-PII] uridylyltransferase [Cocleimonas sp.]